MAESKIDSNTFNLNEELLRDSLEIDEELCDNFYDVSSIKSNGIESQKPSPEDTDVLSLNGQVAMVSTVDAPGQNQRPNVKTQLVKPKSKNMIKFNKVNIAKYHTKTSYSKLYEKKLGRAILMEKKDENRVDQGVSNPCLSSAATEIQKQFVLDGILTEKNEDIRLYHPKYGVEETNQSYSRFGDQYKVESARSSETIMPNLGKGCCVEESSITNNLADSNSGYQNMPRNLDGGLQSYFQDERSQPQLPLIDLRSPTSVQSAPADLQAHQDLSYEKATRSNSICALQSEEAYDDQLNNFTTSFASIKPVSEQGNYITYHSIFANAKQNGRTNYKPYTLGDYKRLKKQSKPGGLGPDTKSEKHQQKAKKAFRQRKYSEAVKQRNASANFQAKKKKTLSTNNISDQFKQEANARRIKAMEYAKAIRKPITSKNYNARKSPTQAVEEPRTFLSILQQRHEDEKKAIDAMRKNLRAKLKIR